MAMRFLKISLWLGFCLVVTNPSVGQELVTNGEFLESSAGWFLEFGATLGYEPTEGHDTAGAARVDGPFSDHGIGQCIDVSMQPAEASYDLLGCFRAMNYELTKVGFDVAYWGSSDCTSSHISSMLMLEAASGQNWQRVDLSITAPPGTLAIEILPLSSSVPIDGVTFFDSFSLMRATFIFSDGFENGTTGAWSLSQ